MNDDLKNSQQVNVPSPADSNATELWQRYQRKNHHVGRVSGVGLGILVIIALAVLFTGLWIVAFR
ncbi:hypothetical protein EBU99_03955 [bacterium]|nr:hypothetical protein [bacterium]